MIRLATQTDLAEVAVLEIELFGREAWDGAALLAELEGPGRRFVVHTDDDEGTSSGLTGYAVSMSLGDVVDLQRIGVRPSRQRAGVAGLLLRDLIDHPGHADRMLLEVSEANRAAIAFYTRHGFERIDVRPRYYRDGSDAWVLGRALSQCSGATGRME